MGVKEARHASAASRHSERASRTPAGGTTLKRVALVLVGTGVLLLAFVAYQLWGTALYEHQAQARLRQELRTELGAKAEQDDAPQKSSAPLDTNASEAEITSRAAPLEADPAVGRPIGFMSIPVIGMSGDAIVEGTGEAQLQEGPGHYQGTALPGEAGNAAIAGHRTTYAHPFYNLNEMQPGDLIYITTNQGLFDYQVTASQVVAPTNVSVLGATPVPTLTLTTCNPRYSATQRLVVTAVLAKSVTSSSFPTSSTPTTTTTARAPSPPKTLAGEGGVSGPSTAGEVGQGVLWGVLALALAVGAVIGWRRLGRPWAWVIVVLGTPAVLAVLLVCFQHVSLSLPETF